MGLHHRKLIPHLCTLFSNQTLSYCSTSSNNNNPPPTPPIFPHTHHHSLQVSTFFIITITLLASSFLVLLCFLIHASFFSRRRRLLHLHHQSEEARDIFFDVEHGPMRTSGLQKSLISENIAVCKYKKGEGLVEGTECSVCLSEFEDDENLGILPKCNHAFHVSCIDAWLVSHSNCPLCRAPIVEDTQMETMEDWK